MPKPELEFFDTLSLPWRPTAHGIKGQYEKILAHDDETGVGTRLLKFEPGCDTSRAGVLVHDFWEEIYVVEGSLYDLTLGETFRTGAFACRPPGMRHGPWRSPEGCITFEVRYYAREE